MNIIIPGMAEFPKFFEGFDHISFFENELSKYWKQNTRIVDNIVKRKSWSISLENHLDDINVKQYYDQFLLNLSFAINKYNSNYIIKNMEPEQYDGIKAVTLLKYEQTDEIDYHYDTSYSDNRVAAALGYFNDDYSGGNLHFKHFDLEFKPKANSLLIFPANYPYLHRSNQVDSGIKYAIRCFLVSKN